jgi:hypothetical protein
MSLKHTINSDDFVTKLGSLLLNVFDSDEFHNIINMFNLIDKNDIQNYIESHDREKIFHTSSKYFITFINSDDKYNFRINIKINNYVNHVIELIFLKYNQISSMFSIHEIKNKILVLEHDGVKHRLIDIEKLMLQNKYTIEARKSIAKQTQDYLRISYILKCMEKIQKYD